jgi:hypothetical protein
MTRHAWRLPMLVVLVALLVGAVVVERTEDPPSAEPRLDRATPMVPVAGSLGSTWYCAAGSATGVASGEGAGIAEQTVVVTNVSDQPVTGVVTVFPDEGEAATSPLEVAPHDRVQFAVSEIVQSPWASAVVEVSGGQAAVEHELVGPGGRSIGPCASSPSPQWYFAAGTSRPGTTSLLALFNPFPGEASVDVTFETEDGSRTPQQFQGVVVPGGRVTVLDVGAVVTLRQEIATTVTARNGRIVAEQLLVSDGTDDSPVGLTSDLGAPVASTGWVFPDGTAPGPGRSSTVAVQNPGDADAEVEVQVFLDDPEVNGSVEPFTLSIPGRRYASVDLFADGRIPEGVGSWILVRSVNDVAVVAARLEGGTDAADVPGLAATTGSPIVADEWVLPMGAADLAGSALVLVNPQAVGEVTVTLEASAGGELVPLPGIEEIVLAPGSRQVVDLGVDGAGVPGLTVVARASGSVVVSRTMTFEGGDASASVAMPVTGTESPPTDLARPEAFLTEAPVVPDDPETTVGGS